MQNDKISEENKEIKLNEKSRRIFINAVLVPLKQIPNIGTSPKLLTLQERKGIDLEMADQAKVIQQRQTTGVLERDIKKNHETIASLSSLIQEKEARERELTNKIDGTWKICDIFTKHFNVLSDNYKGLENERDNLSGMFNKVLLVQEKEIKQLKEVVEHHESASTGQKKLLEEAANRSMTQEQRIHELLDRISELESSLSAKQNTINTFAAENTQLLQDCENLSAEADNLYLCLKQAEAEKKNAQKSLAEKNELERELHASSLRVEELSRSAAEYSAKNELLVREKEDLEKQMENMIVTKEENAKLAIELTNWKEKSKEADENCLKSEQSLRDVQNKYRELERRYNELEKSATEERRYDGNTIKELRDKLGFMEKKQKQQASNKELEIEKLKESFEKKHKHEVTSLTANKRQLEIKLSGMEKTLSEEKHNQKRINVKLTETMEQNALLQSEIQQMKATINKLEKELNEKVTTNKYTAQCPDKRTLKDKHDKYEIESKENNKDVTDNPIISDNLIIGDIQSLTISKERRNVSSLMNKSTKDTFSRGSQSVKSNETVERNPYDFADDSSEEDLYKSLSSYKELGNTSSDKLRERRTLSQPTVEFPFRTPKPVKNPPTLDPNTSEQQKKKRSFLLDGSVMKEVTKPKKRK